MTRLAVIAAAGLIAAVSTVWPAADSQARGNGYGHGWGYGHGYGHPYRAGRWGYHRSHRAHRPLARFWRRYQRFHYGYTHPRPYGRRHFGYRQNPWRHGGPVYGRFEPLPEDDLDGSAANESVNERSWTRPDPAEGVPIDSQSTQTQTNNRTGDPDGSSTDHHRQAHRGTSVWSVTRSGDDSGAE